MLFIFWELVGFTSYVLIGHWFFRGAAAAAANKAFITTRIGDFGFMIGILMIWMATGSIVFSEVTPQMPDLASHPTFVTITALLIFCGAVGKSAQFPLHVWLPDAMEGPTPISALIHAATMVAAGVYMDERPPLRPLRFANQAHMRFARESITLARVAADARANHVLPRGRPSPVTRYDVIQIEFTTIENLATVLAGILVALEHVVPGKFYFLLRKPIKNEKHNHPRDTNLERNRSDDFVIRSVCRQVAPAFKIVRHEIVRLVRRNDVGVTCVNKRKGATRRADVNRLPQAVKHQNLII